MSREFARELRNSATIHERILWDALRKRKREGCRFRRQFPIGNYVVDFLCLERRLIVELDGAFHNLQRERDAARTARLQSEGFRVVRFWNSDLIDNLEDVLEGIARDLRLAVGECSPKESTKDSEE